MFRNTNFWPSSWATSVFSLILGVFSLAVAAALSHQTPPAIKSADDNDKDYNKQMIQIACLGNSIQYYNDCPRLLERMFQSANIRMSQESCLRGGASIVSLWEKGNGMAQKFSTPNARKPNGSYDIGAPTVVSLLENETFDYVIINDHTQSPARQSSRQDTLKLLRDECAPLLIKSSITPIFLQTAAYRLPNFRGTKDLGDFDRYTRLLQEGYQEYQQLLNESFEQSKSKLRCRIAPVGTAYSSLHHSDEAMWHKLYDRDNFHPGPYGTLLQAYVLFMTITGEEPPLEYDPSWWDRARRMQPPEEEPMPRPSLEEALKLRHIAIETCRMRAKNL